MGWQTFCSSPMEKISFFTNVESWYRIFISLLILGFSCIIIRYFIACMTFSSKIRGKYRKTASAIWTRRRVYWRKRRLSRSVYLVEMKSRQTNPTGVVISFQNIPTTAPSHRTLNDNVQGQTLISRPLATKKSCGGGKTGQSALNYAEGGRVALLERSGLGLRLIAEGLPPNRCHSLKLRNVSGNGWDIEEDVLTRSILSFLLYVMQALRVTL